MNDARNQPPATVRVDWSDAKGNRWHWSGCRPEGIEEAIAAAAARIERERQTTVTWQVTR